MEGRSPAAICGPGNRVLGRRQVFTLGMAMGTGLIARQEAHSAPPEAEDDILYTKEVSPADSLLYYLDLLSEIESAVLRTRSLAWSDATTTVNSLLRELERLVNQLVRQIPELQAETSGAPRQIRDLAEASRAQLKLARTELSERPAIAGTLLAAVATSTGAMEHLAAAAPGRHTISDEAWETLRAIVRLVRGMPGTVGLNDARDRLAAARDAYFLAADNVRKQAQSIRGHMVRASIAVARQEYPEYATAAQVGVTVDPIEEIQEAINELKSLGNTYQMPYSEQRGVDPGPLELLVNGLTGAQAWIVERRRRGLSTVQAAMESRAEVVLAAQAKETPVGRVLIPHCPAVTLEQVRQIVILIGPFWLPILPQSWREGHIRRVLLRLARCIDATHVDKAAQALAKLPILTVR